MSDLWKKLWNSVMSMYYEGVDGTGWIVDVKDLGDKLVEENKQLKRQSIQDHEDYGNLLDKKHELNQKLEAIHELGLCSLIADMREDLMGFYRHWQENRDFEDYHKPVKPSDMRAVRKYMQGFEHVESKLKELLGK